MPPTKPAETNQIKAYPDITETANPTKAVINKLPSRDKLTTPTFSLIVSPNTAKTIGVLKDIIVIKVASILPKSTPTHYFGGQNNI